MDCSKAFDMVRWTQLFTKLLDRGVSPVFLRLILFIYRNQYCDVRWNGKFSNRFSVSNGVRQGAVSSPIFFCIYVDELIQELRQSGLGCRIGGYYLGIAVYADDIFLLSASRNGLQSMVNICQKFADNFNLKFSTNPNMVKSKTKCIVFSQKVSDRRGLPPIMLSGNPLPWVEDLKHLGNTLQSDNSMKTDISVKRAIFIRKVHSLNQEFFFCNPNVVINLYRIYACSFYSSSLYDLYSCKLTRLYSSWNKAVRILFNLPLATHTYLIETVSRSLHPKVMLCSRFIGFHKANVKSSRNTIQLLTNISKLDQRTTYGRNLKNIAEECNKNIDDLTNNDVKELMKFKVVPAEEVWRAKLVDELLGIKFGSLDTILEQSEIDDLLRFICAS